MRGRRTKAEKQFVEQQHKCDNKLGISSAAGKESDAIKGIAKEELWKPFPDFFFFFASNRVPLPATVSSASPLSTFSEKGKFRECFPGTVPRLMKLIVHFNAGEFRDPSTRPPQTRPVPFRSESVQEGAPNF